MIKQVVKTGLMSILLLSLTACDQLPTRNPFQGRQEPKLGALPAQEQKKSSLAKVAWSSSVLAKQEPFIKLFPTAKGEAIYVADHAGKVVALDRTQGKKIWSSNTGEKFTAGPTITDSMVLLATKDAKIVALNRADGHQLWQAKISSEVLSPPTYGQGIVLVHAIDGTITALNAENGQAIWQAEQSTPSLTLHYSSAPAIAGNHALVGLASGKLMAFDLRSGVLAWERTISMPRGRSEVQRMVDISADPLIDGTMAYVITYQGKLAAVNVASGDLLWEREISSYQNMAMDQERLYITDNAHDLWAIDRQSGATLWRQNALAQRYITGPAVVRNMIAVADRGGYIHFVSAKNGQVISSLEFTGKIYQNPISIGDQLVINNNKGKIATIKIIENSEQA